MPDRDPGPFPAAALRQSGLKPRKRLGQNFLQDPSFLERVVQAAGVGPEDEVLELGAGTGVLTRALAEHASRVVAVELDDALFALLRSQFAGSSTVELVHADALEVEPCHVFAGPYSLVGNIPYYVTGQIIRRYLEARCRPRILVLMVQREVAERMVAAPGRLSLLGVAVQYFARAEIVARVPAGAFFPPPKVESAIVRLTPYERKENDADREAFFEVVRAGFHSRRKQLGNALSGGLGVPREEVRAALRRAEIDDRRRAETLTLEEWRRLAGIIRRSGEQ